MNALCDLAAERPGWIDGARLDDLLTKGALDASGEMAGRITLLQLAAQRKLLGVLPAARQIAADPQACVSLRLSAIACLGQMGQAEDRQFLEHLRLKEPGAAASRLSAALEPALARLKQAHPEPARR